MKGGNELRLSRSAVLRLLTVVACLLFLASTIGQLVKYGTGRSSLYGLIPLFYIDHEGNVPSFFAAVLLLIAALLLGVIAKLKANTRDTYRYYWTVLSIGFTYMALDEAAEIHELLNRPTRELLGGWASGVFTFAWLAPGTAIVLLVALSFLRFCWRLPKETRFRVLTAAVLYIGGLIGVEMIGALYFERWGVLDLTYSMIVTVEEILEMAGVIVFIDALLQYIEVNYAEIRLQFVDDASASAVESPARPDQTGQEVP